MARHRVGSAEIEVYAEESETGRDLIARISRLRPRIEPILDQVFAAASGPDVVHRLDELDLDLGPLPVFAFEETFLRALRTALESALTRALAGAKPLRRAPASLELLEVFAWTGQLPWWADRDAPDVVRDHLRSAMDEGLRDLIALLRSFLGEPEVLARLATHLDDQAARALVERARSGAGEAFLRAVTDRTSHKRPRDASFGARGRALLLELVARDQGNDVHGLVRSALEALAPPPSEEPQNTAGPDAASKRSPHPPATSHAPPSSEPSMPKAGRRDGPALEAENPSGSLSFAVASPPPGDGGMHRTLPPFARPASGRVPRSAEPRRRILGGLDELETAQAGLVLLWPFFPRFFSRVGLLDEVRKFYALEKQGVAAKLLGYLASGRSVSPEYEMILAKLLAGLPPEAALLEDDPFAPEALLEADTLLSAALAHVAGLGDMPVARFRSTFLTRRGTLGVRDGAWLLRVEKDAYDVLLDRVPWSWAWVKHPWMPWPLRVEW